MPTTEEPKKSAKGARLPDGQGSASGGKAPAKKPAKGGSASGGKAPTAKIRKTKDDASVESAVAMIEPVVSVKKGSWIYGLGRRKSSIARVRLIQNGKGAITVNGKPFDDYFGAYELREIVKGALKIVGLETAADVSTSVEGGGLRGQAESIRLGLSRALVILNPTYRKTLKKLGYLTRDPRSKERKKFGLKRARRAPQWSKR